MDPLRFPPAGALGGVKQHRRLGRRATVDRKRGRGQSGRTGARGRRGAAGDRGRVELQQGHGAEGEQAGAVDGLLLHRKELLLSHWNLLAVDSDEQRQISMT